MSPFCALLRLSRTNNEVKFSVHWKNMFYKCVLIMHDLWAKTNYFILCVVFQELKYIQFSPGNNRVISSAPEAVNVSFNVNNWTLKVLVSPKIK